MTIVLLIRHGNTDWNREGRTQGHLNNPLNRLGVKQATALAERLSEEKWDIIVSSDLLRARQTAEIISRHLGNQQVQYDDRLREIDRGQIAGSTERERIAKWGDNWSQLDLGQESLSSVRKRGTACINELVEKYSGQKILVVSHGLLLRETLKGLLNNEATGTHLENTSVTTLETNVNGWRYLSYNSISHLREEEYNYYGSTLDL